MTLAFAFPSDELSPYKIDDIFEAQAQELSDCGFPTWTIKIDEGKLRTCGDDLRGATVIYRGWMLNAEEHKTLSHIVQSREATLFTSTEQYLAAHHIPKWYPYIKDLTPETVFLPTDANLSAELKALGWDKFIIKDYVKSLKTATGSIISDPDMADEVAAQMKHFRGTIEGGFSIRRYEELLPEAEKRYFVLSGEAFGPTDGEPIPDIVRECAKRLTQFSPFFSIDISKRADGELRVVEIGDGGVSDIVGWTVERFAEIFKKGLQDAEVEKAIALLNG
jgi:hypothetical protein